MSLRPLGCECFRRGQSIADLPLQSLHPLRDSPLNFGANTALSVTVVILHAVLAVSALTEYAGGNRIRIVRMVGGEVLIP